MSDETDTHPDRSEEKRSVGGNVVLPKWVVTIVTPLVTAFSLFAVKLMWDTRESTVAGNFKLDAMADKVETLSKNAYTIVQAQADFARRDLRMDYYEKDLDKLRAECAAGTVQATAPRRPR